MLDLPSVAETLAATRPRPATSRRSSARPTSLSFRALAASVRVAPAIKEYVVDLVRATRDPAALRPRPGAPARARGQPARHDRPGPRRRGHALLCRPRLRHAPRRQEPGPRRHAPPDPRQLRGRRRRPLARRPPPADPRPHPACPEGRQRSDRCVTGARSACSATASAVSRVAGAGGRPGPAACDSQAQ